MQAKFPHPGAKGGNKRQGDAVRGCFYPLPAEGEEVGACQAEALAKAGEGDWPCDRDTTKKTGAHAKTRRRKVEVKGLPRKMPLRVGLLTAGAPKKSGAFGRC
jgi:hypothetical protein